MNGRKNLIIGFLTFCIVILFTNSPVSFASTKDNAESDIFLKAYETGRSKGILTDNNMDKKEFISMCKKVVFPDYLEFQKSNPTISFSQYVAEDNYEVPETNSGDQPTTINYNDDTRTSIFTSFVAAHNKYHMKAGDILICYGTGSFNNTITTFPGHAAIATSSKYILEMPGTKNRSAQNNARHISKKQFFSEHTKGSKDYVAVYRIKNHPVYADHASTYAYRYMYKKDNPTYDILKAYNLYIKSPSYCSKYVYYAYWKGATAKSVNIYHTYWWIRPHNLMNYFSSSFHPAYIHKITRY